nr:S-layer homology domain-containing protein [Paenibacillus phyllosphaerae]
MDVIKPANGSYAAKITIPVSADFAPYGTYRVAASSSSATLTKSFSVVETLSGGDVGGLYPGDGGSTTPDEGTSPPGSSSPIPADAGQTANAVIEPELAADGSFRFGADTLAAAIAQARDAVTVELPADAGTADYTLEFPAQALSALNSAERDLILVFGGGSIRLPAGAASSAANGGQAGTIRIVVNTALTDEVKQQINQAANAYAGYRFIGAAISVDIQLVAGGSSTAVHQLDQQATVTLKLTDDQQRSVTSGLAGVYYVNGNQLEYVVGTADGGSFTFRTNHFSTYAVLDYTKSFADLKGHWAEKSVLSLAARHIVTGVDEQHFAPARQITRAEFTTMIMRSLEWTGNVDVQAGGASFTDVAAGSYYADAVAKAAALGIVTGNNGEFLPNAIISREEAITILVRAAGEFNLTASNEGKPAFSDADEISAWAVEAVNQAWSKGLIEGNGQQLYPKKSVTRAEAAVMINRLLPAGT